MKIFLLSVFAIVLFSFNGNAQTDQANWEKIMTTFNNNLNQVLTKECPKDIDIKDFKLKLMRGEIKLSQEAENKILEFSKELEGYGREFANRNNLEIEDSSDAFFYSGFYPELPINDGMFNLTNEYSYDDILNCAAIALGVDFLWAAGSSTISTWSWLIIKKTFKSIAMKFLGPVGVLIAVSSFSYCMLTL